MNSLALQLFTSLCEVGNVLEYYRDLHPPGSDDWTALTEILGLLDLCIDRLVRSNGIDEDNDA